MAVCLGELVFSYLDIGSIGLTLNESLFAISIDFRSYVDDRGETSMCSVVCVENFAKNVHAS